MDPVQIHEAKAKLSSLIDAALSGEEVVIARRNRPLVRLVPLVSKSGARRIGSAKGLVRMAPDFDDIPEGFEEYSQ
jgi:prevent-host-death family protein